VSTHCRCGAVETEQGIRQVGSTHPQYEGKDELCHPLKVASDLLQRELERFVGVNAIACVGMRRQWNDPRLHRWRSQWFAFVAFIHLSMCLVDFPNCAPFVLIVIPASGYLQTQAVALKDVPKAQGCGSLAVDLHLVVDVQHVEQRLSVLDVWLTRTQIGRLMLVEPVILAGDQG